MTKLIIDAAVAVGTLVLAAIALWKDWILSKVAPAKLIIVPHTPKGDPTETGNHTRLMYFHLKVVNQRPWMPALNCRVLLKGLTRRGPDDIFHPVPLAVPSQFVWAPAELTPSVITVVREQILDFGYLVENADRFMPTLYSIAHNFQGFVRANEAVRFHLQIEAQNFSMAKYQVFEVAWDGQWSHEPDIMEQHLRLREIAAS